MTAFPYKYIGQHAYSMREKIVIIEALIFALPLLILLYIFYQGNYYFEPSQIVLFSGIVVFILAGMIILRQALGMFSIVAMSLRKAESGDAVTIDLKKDVVELHEISVSFNNIIQKLGKTSEELAHKSFQLSIIKDLTEIAKDNLSIDDQMNLLLEKSMAVTGAQIGSVLMVEQETRQKYLAVPKSTPMNVSELYRFRIGAARGHDEELRKDSYIDIDSSVAKAVLLERGPLLVQDIENDPRILKTNDLKYGPPSFLSMPIFIGDSVSAILNLAYKEKSRQFDGNDVEVLSIMLRDISFALEIAKLQSKIMEQLVKINGHNIKLEKEIEGRKRTERALIENEKKFRLLVETSNDIIYTTNLTG
ncbi:MAG: GAF domain-containing protein, partial [Pseudomonadota bacterium]